MENLFFNTTYSSMQDTLLKIAVFLLIAGLFIWLIHLVFSKLLFRKNKQRKEVHLRLAFLWAITGCILLFNSYVLILLYRNGLDNLQWTSVQFYLGILPQLVTYTALIVFFFMRRSAFKKIIHQPSIL